MRRNRLTRLFLFTFLAAAILVAAGPLQAGENPIFMWQVKSETATVSLVGSIHVGKPDFFPLAEPFETAFASVPVLAVEVDMTDPANLQKSGVLIMQKGMLPGGTTLQDRLSPELWKRMEEYAAESNMNLAMYSKLKPGLVAMVMVLEEYKKQGYDPELGIDMHFLEAAKEQGKEIRELESIEAQLDLFFSIDDQLDDILMAEFLDQMDEIVTMTEEMVGCGKPAMSMAWTGSCRTRWARIRPWPSSIAPFWTIETWAWPTRSRSGSRRTPTSMSL